jgi:hypothetical protein
MLTSTQRFGMVVGAAVFLTTTVCSAICLTKEDLTKDAQQFATDNGNTYRVPDDDHFQQAALFLRDLFKKILTTTPGELIGKDSTALKASEQIQKLKDRNDIWQLFPQPAEAANAAHNLTVVQTWVNKGELVIATYTPADAGTASQVALVVPGDASAVATLDTIMVSYAGPPVGRDKKNTVSASSSLNTAFPSIDPSKLVFYRYKL